VIALPIFLRRVFACQKGTAITEFAFVLGPMLLLIMGGFELAYESYLRGAVQGALSDAARRGSVQNPVFTQTGKTLNDQIKAAVSQVAVTIAPDAKVTITQHSYYDFGTVGNPELLMTDKDHDGVYDAADRDCFKDTNFNNRFDTDSYKDGRGGADDVVFYRAEITAPRLLPLEGFTPFANEFTIVLETAIRNQPYGTQTVPPVVCGAG